MGASKKATYHLQGYKKGAAAGSAHHCVWPAQSRGAVHPVVPQEIPEGH